MKSYVRFIATTAILLVAGFFFAASCASAPRPDGKNGILHGMIYDYDNAPVCGYLVLVDDAEKAYTDINGRFTIPDIPLGTHRLSGEGKDHGLYTQIVDFADRTQILYLRIPSNQFLYTLIDRQLTEKEYSMAQDTLHRFSMEEQKSKKFNLYKTITLFYISPEDDRSEYYSKARLLTRDLINE